MMQRLAKWAGRGALIAIVALAALWLFGPREPVDIDFAAPDLPTDLDAYLAAHEGNVPGLRAGVAKRIHWAQTPGARTEWAVVYVHGFSATSEEIRPVPDQVAAALGANLHYTRLTGHGQDGAAMAAARIEDWTRDYAEALAVGAAIGRRVLVIATSTGGTLAALGASQGTAPDAITFVSPNFGLANPASQLLTAPAARHWLPLLMGEIRRTDVTDPTYLKYWTTDYPVTALLPMAALVKHTYARDFAPAMQPALFLFADADRVVSAARTRDVASRWGGPVSVMPVVVGAGDDPWSHVIAGDIVSPSMTRPTVAMIVGWAQGL